MPILLAHGRGNAMRTDAKILACFFGICVIVTAYTAAEALAHPGPGDFPQVPRGWLFAHVVAQAMIFMVPLLLTLVVEVPVIAIAGRGSAAAWKAGVLVNTLTNPPAVFALGTLYPFFYKSYWAGGDPIGLVCAIEIAVVLAEWRLLKWVLGWSSLRALITSSIANGLSFSLGALLVSRAVFL